MNSTQSGQRRRAGFTLVELMIAVAIVAILAAIAYPSYQEQIRKANRADAQADLLNLAQFMERYYTQNNRYTTTVAATAYPDLPFTESPSDGGHKKYDLTVIGPGGAGTFNVNEYILAAAPKAGTNQANDGTLRLDNAGRKFWDENNDGDFTDAGEDHW